MFKVNNKDTRTPLAFRIFDSIRHHSISMHSKICFGKGRCCRKKVTKSKIGSQSFTLTKKWFNSTEISNQRSMFIFSCTSNFFALVILQPETVKLNVTKSYILVDVVGVLALVQPAYLCGEVLNLILWTFYFTISCNNRNYYISVSSLK